MATTPGRVLVLGGRGFFGRRVVQVLRTCADLEVVVGGPRSVPPVDLTRRETFEALAGFDVIVNCADSILASPVRAAHHVLQDGGVWIDTTADTATIEQLLALHATTPRGHVVVGVGLVPGLLTMLGHHVAALVQPCERLQLGVRLSALSGAGRGTCRVMVDALDRPGADPRGSAAALGVAITLPDRALMRRGASPAVVQSDLTLVPGGMRPIVTLARWLLAHAGPFRRALMGLVHGSLVLLRAVVLRAVGTSVQLTAVANDGSVTATTRALHLPDRRQGHALGVAAVVLLWRTHEPPEPGVVVAASVFGLDEALVRLRLAGLVAPKIIDPAVPVRPERGASF